jgi:hypothetical protein
MMRHVLSPTLRQNFNVFGPQFYQWLHRMLPRRRSISGFTTAVAAGDIPDTTERQMVNRLIDLWVSLHIPKPAI